MRAVIVAASFAAAVALPLNAYAAPKAKQTRYCIHYRNGGGENCGFLSMQQCLQALSGDGGMCVVAAVQDPRIKRPAPVAPMNPRDEDDTE